MKKLLTICVMLLFGVVVFAQNNTKDVLYLKNGSVIKGSVIEFTPNNSVKIQTSDGSIFVYPATEVDKLVKEENSKDSKVLDDNNFIEKKYPRYRSVAAAWALSFFVCPGTGQLYNGQIGEGIGFIILDISSLSYMYAGYINENDGAILLGAALYIGGWLWSWIDAIAYANKINRQNGFASIRLSDKMNLAFTPEIKPNINPDNKVFASYGIGLSLRF